MKTYRIAVTPLSPLHIGCGEVYEPTNYVVDAAKALLYSFSPAGAFISEGVRSEMMKAALTGRYQDMRAFFSRHLDDFRPWAEVIVPMDGGSVSGYRKMLNPQGKQKDTEFAVQRTSYGRTARGVEAYVPGSSLKGVAKTALADRLNNRQPIDARDINSTLFKGDFDESPFRFLKIGDLHAEGGHVQVRSRCSGRFFKSKDFKYCGITDYFEAVEPAQYRVFTGEAALTGDKSVTGVAPAYESLEAMLQDIHRYAANVWLKEAGWYRQADSQWARSVDGLLSALNDRFASGRAALVRLGKNAGAESKTLNGVAKIQIRHRDKTREIKDHATTLWLTPEKTPANEDRGSGMPFGWAIVEILDGSEMPALKSWCDDVAKKLPVTKVELEKEWALLDEAKAKANKARDAREAEAVAEAKRRAEAKAAEEARAAELSAMTAERREASEVMAKFEKAGFKAKPGDPTYVLVRDLINKAAGWSDADRRYVFDLLQPKMKASGMYDGNKGKEIKKAFRVLSGEA